MRAFHAPLVKLFATVASEIRAGEISFRAAEFETSLALELFPDLVRTDRAERVDPPGESLPLTDYDALGENRVGWPTRSRRARWTGSRDHEAVEDEERVDEADGVDG